MISGVSSSQKVYPLVATGAERSKNAINGDSERPNEENLGYRLSLSDENWKILGNKDKKSDEGDKFELSEEDLRKIEELKKIDKKVHTHEQAHLSAAGGYARGGASYDYVTGPDGNRYANAGHVNLDTGKEKTPEATIIKAKIIEKAALAPADPSPADKQIAVNAAKMAADAQKEIAEQKMPKFKNTEKQQRSNDTQDNPDAPDAPQAAVSESTN
jgi:hypothetical protein